MHKTILTAALLAAASFHANATGTPVEVVSNAQLSCDPALPIYDSNLRQRPRAVVNESTTNTSAFATCGFSYVSNSYGIEFFRTRVGNINPQGSPAITVKCTGVIGVEGEVNTQFITKTVQVNPGDTALLSWSGADRYQTAVAVSCLLPQGGSVTQSTIRYRQGG